MVSSFHSETDLAPLGRGEVGFAAGSHLSPVGIGRERSERVRGRPGPETTRPVAHRAATGLQINQTRPPSPLLLPRQGRTRRSPLYAAFFRFAAGLRAAGLRAAGLRAAAVLRAAGLRAAVVLRAAGLRAADVLRAAGLRAAVLRAAGLRAAVVLRAAGLRAAGFFALRAGAFFAVVLAIRVLSL